MVALPGGEFLPAPKVVHGHLHSDPARVKELGRKDLDNVAVQVYKWTPGNQDQGFLEVTPLELLPLDLPERGSII